MATFSYLFLNFKQVGSMRDYSRVYICSVSMHFNVNYTADIIILPSIVWHQVEIEITSLTNP